MENEPMAGQNVGTTSPSPAPQMPIGEQVLPAASDLFKQTWQFYKEHLWTLVGISALPVVGFFIMGLLLAAITQFNKPGASTSTVLLIVFLIIFVALIYISLWSTVALLAYIRDRAENLSITDAYRRGKSFIGAFFTTGFLTGLAVAGGFILFIIPGIIFGLWFSQSGYVVMSESLKNTAAMKRSKYYVKGRMGSVFLKMLYIAVILIAISIVVSIILGIAGLNGSKDHPNMVGSILNTIVSIFLTPLSVIYGYMLYENLKRTRPAVS